LSSLSLSLMELSFDACDVLLEMPLKLHWIWVFVNLLLATGAGEAPSHIASRTCRSADGLCCSAKDVRGYANNQNHNGLID
jgi:hypothetical protein